MTYEEIFSRTKALIPQGKMDVDGHLAVQIDIRGEGEGAFYIELKDGNVFIEPYEYYDRDCKFIIKGDDFLKICDGSLDAVKAFTVGKLKIEGSIDKALEFSKIVEKVRAQSKTDDQPVAEPETLPEKASKNGKN